MGGSIGKIPRNESNKSHPNHQFFVYPDSVVLFSHTKYLKEYIEMKDKTLWTSDWDMYTELGTSLSHAEQSEYKTNPSLCMHSWVFIRCKVNYEARWERHNGQRTQQAQG